MTTTVARSRDVSLRLRAYTTTLIVCASLYFLRVPEYSVYVFDAVWLLGLMLFPQYFWRMPTLKFITLCSLAVATLLSIGYALVDNRQIDLVQASATLLRYLQMAMCANFFYNCVRSGELRSCDYLVPSLIAILIPLLGGMALHMVAPDLTVVFNRYSGYFGNPNTLSLYIVVSSAVFYQIMHLQPMSGWMAYLILFLFVVVAAYSLILSGSNSGILLALIVTTAAMTSSPRGGLLAIIAAGVFYLMIATFKHLILPWALDLLTSDFAGLRRTGKLFLVILEGGELDELGSYDYRGHVEIYLFEEQFRYFFRIFFGLGPGQSKYLTSFLDGNTVTVHNFYKLIFLEYGILGSLCFVASAIVTFNRFFWNFQSLLLFSGFFLASTGTPSLYLPFFWMPLFAALAGMTQIHLRRRPGGMHQD